MYINQNIINIINKYLPIINYFVINYENTIINKYCETIDDVDKYVKDFLNNLYSNVTYYKNDLPSIKLNKIIPIAGRGKIIPTKRKQINYSIRIKYYTDTEDPFLDLLPIDFEHIFKIELYRCKLIFN